MSVICAQTICLRSRMVSAIAKFTNRQENVSKKVQQDQPTIAGKLEVFRYF